MRKETEGNITNDNTELDTYAVAGIYLNLKDRH